MDSKVLAVAVIAIVLAAGIGVWYMSGGDDRGGDETVTDALGRTVSVPENADKVVCLSAGSSRLVCYLGAYDRIVGVDDQDSGAIGSPANYHMATYRVAYDFSRITNVGSEENFRGIISTGANLIVTSLTDKTQVDTLQLNTGIPVIAVTAAGNIDVDDEGFDSNLRILGKALGLESRAEELIKGKDAILSELSSYRSSSVVEPKCYIGGMFYMMKGGLDMTTGNYAPFDYVGAGNSMPDANSGNPYLTSIKEIASSGAELMFVDSMTLSGSKATFEQNRNVLSALPAVSDGLLYSTLVYKYYGTNWEAELMNAYFIGSVIDPPVFDYDVAEKANMILDLFYPDSDVDYDTLCGFQTGYSSLDW